MKVKIDLEKEIAECPINAGELQFVCLPAHLVETEDEAENEFKIILPDSVEEENRNREGYILSIGVQAAKNFPTYKVGDRALYSQFSGLDLKFHGKRTYTILEGNCIFATFKKDSEDGLPA